MAQNNSHKFYQIEKANRTIFIALVASSAIVAFSLVASRNLMSLSQYNSKLISKKNKAALALKTNDVAVGKLIDSFKAFEETPESVLGTTDKNSKIVLDALPSEYDFPALASSLEKILTDGGYNIEGITGIDNEATEMDEKSATPTVVEMPFTISVSGPYEKITQLPVDLERSIRPIKVTSMSLSGSTANGKLTIKATTYYQPGKSLGVKYEEVR